MNIKGIGSRKLGLWIQVMACPLVACCAAGSEVLQIEATQIANESLLTVSVSTVFPQCHQLLLDRAVGRVEAPIRPISILTFSVVDDATGEKVIPRPPLMADKTGVAAGDLVLATCWSRFSWLVDLTDYPWLYKLDAGRTYRVRTCFRSGIKTYFEKHPQERQGLVTRFGYYETELDRVLQDVEGCADEVKFTLLSSDNPRGKNSGANSRN